MSFYKMTNTQVQNDNDVDYNVIKPFIMQSTNLINNN